MSRERLVKFLHQQFWDSVPNSDTQSNTVETTNINTFKVACEKKTSEDLLVEVFPQWQPIDVFLLFYFRGNNPTNTYSAHIQWYTGYSWWQRRWILIFYKLEDCIWLQSANTMRKNAFPPYFFLTHTKLPTKLNFDYILSKIQPVITGLWCFWC